MVSNIHASGSKSHLTSILPLEFYGVPGSVCNGSVVFDDRHVLVVIAELFDDSMDLIGVIDSGLGLEDRDGCPGRKRDSEVQRRTRVSLMDSMLNFARNTTSTTPCFSSTARTR